MVFLLKEIPAKHKQPAQSVHGRAAQGLLKMSCLLHTVDLSVRKLYLSVFRGHTFYSDEIKNCKESSGQKWPMQWWKHSKESYMCERSNCRFGNYNFLLGLNEIFLARSVSMWTSGPAAGTPGLIRAFWLHVVLRILKHFFIPTVLPVLLPNTFTFKSSCFCQHYKNDKSYPIDCQIYLQQTS